MRTMQYSFKAHAVKHEPLALQILEQTLELGLQLRFTCLGRCKPVNSSLEGSRCHLAKILEDCKFTLEISGPKVVLLCKFSLYRAVQTPIGARALRLMPHQSHG